MKTLRQCCAVLIWSYFILGTVAAQDPSTVPADLKFTQEISTQFHVVAWVTLQTHDGSTEKFQYDRYPSKGLRPGLERVKRSEGVFARPLGKTWMRSDDWGATGSVVDDKMAAVLDTDANVVASLFRPPTNRDTAQGGTVWRYVGATSHGSASECTFAESRENPRPGVNYPKYTFLKAPGDRDGRSSYVASPLICAMMQASFQSACALLTLFLYRLVARYRFSIRTREKKNLTQSPNPIRVLKSQPKPVSLRLLIESEKVKGTGMF